MDRLTGSHLPPLDHTRMATFLHGTSGHYVCASPCVGPSACTKIIHAYSRLRCYCRTPFLPCSPAWTTFTTGRTRHTLLPGSLLSRLPFLPNVLHTHALSYVYTHSSDFTFSFLRTHTVGLHFATHRFVSFSSAITFCSSCFFTSLRILPRTPHPLSSSSHGHTWDTFSARFTSHLLPYWLRYTPPTRFRLPVLSFTRLPRGCARIRSPLRISCYRLPTHVVLHYPTGDFPTRLRTTSFLSSAYTRSGLTTPPRGYLDHTHTDPALWTTYMVAHGLGPVTFTSAGPHRQLLPLSHISYFITWDMGLDLHLSYHTYTSRSLRAFWILSDLSALVHTFHHLPLTVLALDGFSHSRSGTLHIGSKHFTSFTHAFLYIHHHCLLAVTHIPFTLTSLTPFFVHFLVPHTAGTLPSWTSHHFSTAPHVCLLRHWTFSAVVHGNHHFRSRAISSSCPLYTSFTITPLHRFRHAGLRSFTGHGLDVYSPFTRSLRTFLMTHHRFLLHFRFLFFCIHSSFCLCFSNTSWFFSSHILSSFITFISFSSPFLHCLGIYTLDCTLFHATFYFF